MLKARRLLYDEGTVRMSSRCPGPPSRLVDRDRRSMPSPMRQTLCRCTRKVGSRGQRAGPGHDGHGGDRVRVRVGECDCVGEMFCRCEGDVNSERDSRLNAPGARGRPAGGGGHRAGPGHDASRCGWSAVVRASSRFRHRPHVHVRRRRSGGSSPTLARRSTDTAPCLIYPRPHPAGRRRGWGAAAPHRLN